MRRGGARATSVSMIKTGPSLIQDAIVREFQNVHLKGAESHLKHTDPDPSLQPAAASQVEMEPASVAFNKPKVDGEGLIVPRKLNNPCIDSKEVQSLTKEIKWNKKNGTNVLASKSELDKALDRRRWQQGKNEAKLEAEAAKTDFQKAMDERAQRVKNLETSTSASRGDESGNDSGHCSPEPEFMKVRAQVKSKSGNGNK